jgi:hypothetical protein
MPYSGVLRPESTFKAIRGEEFVQQHGNSPCRRRCVQTYQDSWCIEASRLLAATCALLVLCVAAAIFGWPRSPKGILCRVYASLCGAGVVC